MLFTIAKRGDPYELRSRLEAGADPNIPSGNKGLTPLMAAAKEGHLSCIHVLLEFGADINVLDSTGTNALHHAPHIRTKKLLLERSIDPRGGDARHRPLAVFFAEVGESDLVKMFCAMALIPTTS